MPLRNESTDLTTPANALNENCTVAEFDERFASGAAAFEGCDEDRHVFEVEELAASDVAPVNLEDYDSALQIRPHGSVE